jgi:hypothetical protein
MNVQSILDAVRPYAASVMQRPGAFAMGAGKTALRGAFGLPGALYGLWPSEGYVAPTDNHMVDRWRDASTFDTPQFNQPQMADAMKAYIAKMRSQQPVPLPRPAPTQPPMNIMPPAAPSQSAPQQQQTSDPSSTPNFLQGLGGYFQAGSNPAMKDGTANPFYTSGLSNNELVSKVLGMFG